MKAVIGESLMDVNALLNRVNIINTTSINGMTIHKVRIENGCSFLIVITGYGKVNTSRAVQYLKDEYHVDTIILTGNTASTSATDLPFGTVGISTSSFQYDVDFTALGEAEYTLPNMNTGRYIADAGLIKSAQDSTAGLGFNVEEGVYATGDQFLTDGTTATTLATDEGVSFIDSATAAAAQVAYLEGIKYIAVKGVSNYATADAVANYYANMTQANANANAVVYQMLLLMQNEAQEEANETNNQNNSCPYPQYQNRCCCGWRNFFWGF